METKRVEVGWTLTWKPPWGDLVHVYF